MTEAGSEALNRDLAERLKDVEELCELLRGWFDPSPATKFDNWCWERLLATAVGTKTIGLLRLGAVRRGVEIPGPVLDKLARYEATILQNNAANLAWTLRAARVFEEAGITAIFFKGALWVREIYGSIGIRESSDVDVFVARPDYVRAGAALAAIGYSPLVGRADRWWHDHLGESPYGRDGGKGPNIDLHHQVQQPGGPYPRYLDEFLADHITVDFNGHQIRTLSREHGLLLSAIGYGKAVRAKTPWLSHAHELLTACQGDIHALASVARLAERNGLSNLFGDYLRNSFSLFDARQRQAGVQDSEGTPAVLSAIGRPRRSRLFRTRMIWRWSDGAFFVRTIRAAGSLIRVLRETTARRSQSA